MNRGPAKSFSRERVLDVAMVAFWKRGYAATSVADLLEATGLGAKSLYDTFGGKRELYLNCLDHYGATVLSEVFDRTVDGEAPLARLRRVLEGLVRASPRGPARGCLLGVAAAELEDDVELARALKRHLNHIQNSLENVLAEMPLKADGPGANELASMLMTLLQGVHLMSRVDGVGGHARRATQAALALVEARLEP